MLLALAQPFLLLIAAVAALGVSCALFRYATRPGKAARQQSEARFGELESRLQDYGREIDGRVQSAMTLLDRLIDDADAEIEQLQTLVDRHRSPGAVDGSTPKNRLAAYFPPGSGAAVFNSRQKRMIRDLRESGYSVREIAALVDATEDDVDAILGSDGPQSKAA